jgi:eukaryotic-like serine/threonine-protein kinase
MEIERLGPYQIVGKLGRGGMGTVYEAVHRDTGEPAAVKLLSAALAEEEGFRVRFEAEIETLRKLNHPNIVRLFGFGEQEGHLFYAMELVDGNSLEEELRQGRRFEWRDVARIGIETCRALRHAHDRGVIHRDIKPGNLLLTADDRVKLSDFGIARLFGSTSLTGAGNVLGTAEYMAPEQAEGRPVDARADLYSLGALMYALLARRPVFRGKSLPEMLHQQRFEQPEPIRKHAADTPEEMERILGQLLEKDPARRIHSADILARRLEALVHALSLGPETMEADGSWFHSDSTNLPAAPAAAGAPEAKDAAAPSDDLPATQALGTKAAAAPVSGSPPPPLPETARPPETLKSSSPLGHFVAVSEEELDEPDEEEPRPVISWQTGALVAALVAVGLIWWWSLQPPTADSLYGRITARTADKAGDELTAALGDAEDDIRAFLNLYSGDHRAAELRKYQNEIELDRMQRAFNLSLKKNLQPIEQAYVEAMNYVQLEPERGMAKLQAILDLYQQPDRESGLTDQERCLNLVRRRLDQLRAETKKRVEGGKEKEGQLQLLESRLEAADALRQTDPPRAEAMYRAVVELYRDKPWAVEAVRHAREALKAEKPRTP